MILKPLLAFFLFMLILWRVGVPLMERMSIYYPTRPIEGTPAALGIPYEEVRFPAADGVSLSGWWIPAAAAAPWTVLFFHGNAGNISHRLHMVEFFHRLGFSIFLFDYRGYGLSAGSPTEQGLYRDALGARRWLEGRRDVEAGRMLYYGESLGSAVAAELAGLHPPAALVLEGAFTSVPAMARLVYPGFPFWRMVRTRYDTLSKIRAILCPTLIVHSRDDEMIPFSHSEQLFAASGSPRKRFLPLRGGHNEAVSAQREELAASIGDLVTDMEKGGIQ